MASTHPDMYDDAPDLKRTPRRKAAPAVPAGPAVRPQVVPPVGPAIGPAGAPVPVRPAQDPTGVARQGSGQVLPGDQVPADQGTVCEQTPVAWPRLSALGLGSKAVAARRGILGGSDANTILSGSDERVLRLWQEKIGELPPEDLSDKLPVMLGCWTESFNRQWYEARTGHAVTRVGESVVRPLHPWRSATLDGFVEDLGAVFEAKHTSAFVKGEELLARYMPQLQHTMAVMGATRAVLSVIYGNGKWEAYEVASDWLYQADLLEAEQAFWDCVQTGVSPVAALVPPAPRAIGVREVCLDGNNRWASSAADWLQHRLAARAHAEATRTIKELVEPDVARAFGHGIEARRSKAGALTIRELAASDTQRERQA